MKKIFYSSLICIVALAIAFCFKKDSEIIIVAAGDVAKVNGKHVEVANLIKKLDPEKVLILGDIAYDSGTPQEFATLYDPSWGDFKNKTAPSPGNHEYNTPGASGYYDYFGNLAGPDRRGYYSFDLGSWHLISLNSELLTAAQLKWLEDDLAQTMQPCILAYWHKPFLSSGATHGSDMTMKPFWDRLYAKGADLVLNGHVHNYERFGKVNPDNKLDTKGIREFVVGTGGAPLYAFSTATTNSEVRDSTSHGVLQLTLKDTGYEAEFKSATDNFTDKIEDSCN